MNTKPLLASLATALVTLFPSDAHHGLSGFDTSELLRLEGTVVGFELMDPHSRLDVDVKDEEGLLTGSTIAGGSASGILSAGLTPEFLASRPGVVILAYRSLDRRCNPRCLAAGQDFQFKR